VLSPQGIAHAHTGKVGTGGSGRYGFGWRESTLDGPGTRIVWHAGATPGYFSHIVLAPDADLGVIVLSNVYSPAMDAPLAVAAFNLARIAHGQPARPASADATFTAALAGLLVASGVLLTLLLWSVARAIRRRPARSARPARVITGAIGWLGGCAGLMAGAVWALPASMGAGLAEARLWVPDIGHAIIAVVTLAAVLALARTVRTIQLLAQTRRG
jgi:hypothetical protein